MKWHQRLKAALEDKGWTAAELSRRCDIPYDRIMKWLRGEVDNPRGDTITVLAQTLGVDPTWLQTGKTAQRLKFEKNHLIPHATVSELGMIFPNQLADWKGEFRAAPAELSEYCVSSTVADGAMERVLNIKDDVVVDLSLSPHPGDIVALKRGDGVAEFRWYEVPELRPDGSGQVVFRAENTAFPSYSFPLNSGTYEVIGVVRMRITRF